MVKFKIYDKKLQKFVHSDKVWEARYKLGIWNNSVNDHKLGEMYKIMKRNDQHLELYVKIDGRFKPVSKEVIDNVVKPIQKKRTLKERKEYWKKMWKENRLTRRVKLCKKHKSEKNFARRCKRWFKTSKTKKK
jgi:hypothetical protein